jgi:uncharacterized protein YndB with AHSA1/START domain
MDVNEELGTLERHGDLCVLRYRRVLRQPPETVWRALTDDAHLAGWFPTTIEGERSPGAPLRFSFRENEGPPLDGEMVAVDAPSVLELRWGDDLLRFELAPEGSGSVLTLTVTFPEYAKAARDAAGWHVCLEQLAYVAGGEELPFTPSDRWREVHPDYVDRLGPEASVLGPPEEWERAHGAGGGGDQ